MVVERGVLLRDLVLQTQSRIYHKEAVDLG